MVTEFAPIYRELAKLHIPQPVVDASEIFAVAAMLGVEASPSAGAGVAERVAAAQRRAKETGRPAATLRVVDTQPQE